MDHEQHDEDGAKDREEPDSQLAGKGQEAGGEAIAPIEGDGGAVGAVGTAGVGKPVQEGAPEAKDARKRWEEFWEKGRNKLLAAVGTIVVGTITGLVTALLTGVFTSTPSTAAIGNPGHPPGRQDVSTMTSGRQFYAVANFYEFQSCGRPCWLPLYQRPTETSADVTQGWPCEYYQQDQTSSGPTCVNPPAGRTQDEMANPADKNSGDRVLVFCQMKGESIRNDAGQSSDYWDLVAVPKSEISSDSLARGHLSQVPGMPGFYKAYGPDIWLGNTGWHDIPCT